MQTLFNFKIDAEDRRLGFNPWVRKIPWRRKWLPTTHSIVLAWIITQAEEPSGLQSMGSQRVGQN